MTKKKATTRKSGKTPAQLQLQRDVYLRQMVGMVQAHQIPAELLINWDQTGISLLPASDWTLEEKGCRHVKIASCGDKRQITATFAVSMAGYFLPMQLLFEGKTERVHPHHQFPTGFDIWHTINHWSNRECTIRFITNVIVPYIRQTRERLSKPEVPALVIFDAFSGHKGVEIYSLLDEHHILSVKVPNGCTDEAWREGGKGK